MAHERHITECRPLSAKAGAGGFTRFAYVAAAYPVVRLRIGSFSRYIVHALANARASASCGLQSGFGDKLHEYGKELAGDVGQVLERGV